MEEAASVVFNRHSSSLAITCSRTRMLFLFSVDSTWIFLGDMLQLFGKFQYRYSAVFSRVSFCKFDRKFHEFFLNIFLCHFHHIDVFAVIYSPWCVGN